MHSVYGRIIFILIIWFSIPSSATAGLQYLVKAIGPDLPGSANGFENVSTDFEADYTRSGLTFDDALDENVSLGFNFPFNGTTYNKIIISSNGVFYLRTSGFLQNNTERNTAADYTNPQISSNDTLDNAISPYWDDLNLGKTNDGAQGRLRYGTVGSGDGQHFVIWWDDVPRYPNSGSYSLQVALYKNGTIIFRYKDDSNNDTDGSLATIGVKEDSSHYDQNTYNQNNIDMSQDIVYRIYKHLTPITPVCAVPVEKIEMNTYDNTSGHPRDEYLFSILRDNNTVHQGGGYQNRINGSGNPYGGNNNYWSKFSGYIYLPDDGVYQFGVDGDDAVEVYLDDQLITGWYGGHGRANSAQYVIDTDVQSGWHKIAFHQEEASGGDNYYLYWKRPGGNLRKVPSSRFFHCNMTIEKSSCVIYDPINSTTNPKRIPSGRIRYTFLLDNIGGVDTDDVLVEDNLTSNLDTSTIQNLQIQNGDCDCKGVSSASNNGPNGTANGVTPIKLDYDTVDAYSKKCGYFEVDIK